MPFAPVDAKAVLHATPSAIRRRVIAQARPLPLDSRLERVLDRPCQPRELVLAEHAGRAKRVDLRPPESLVHVNVPEPGDGSLIEQRGLDRRAPACELGGEAAGREAAIERLDSEPFLEVRLELAGLE